MVSPEDIRRKADRIYREYLREWILTGAKDYFPRVIPIERKLQSDVAAAAKAIRSLAEGSKESLGYGYRVEWESINSRTYGRNRFPARVLFETSDDLVQYVGRREEYDSFVIAIEKIRLAFPSLIEWAAMNVGRLVDVSKNVDGLLAVAKYICDHPRPGCFARELPVPVDTKFIERHKGVLRDWLDRLLPAHTITADEELFELRYGLRYVEPQILVRFLDQDVQRELGFPVSIVGVPLHTLAGLPVRRTNVIIVENKVNALTIPPLYRSLVIGGLGAGVLLLRHLKWLAQARVIYWGDVDVEGFSILSELRSVFPHVRSVMMDDSFVQHLLHLGVNGSGAREGKGEHLTAGEAIALSRCCESNFRLEQERIPQQIASDKVAAAIETQV